MSFPFTAAVRTGRRSSRPGRAAGYARSTNAPGDKDLYELPPEEHAGIKQVPSSLAEAMDALEEDHDFLTAGDVFTDDLIDTWISIKRGEIDQARLAPTPLEYELYFHI